MDSESENDSSISGDIYDEADAPEFSDYGSFSAVLGAGEQEKLLAHIHQLAFLCKTWRQRTQMRIVFWKVFWLNFPAA